MPIPVMTNFIDEVCEHCGRPIPSGYFRYEHEQKVTCSPCILRWRQMFNQYLRDLRCYKQLETTGNLDADMRRPSFPVLSPF